MRLLSKHLSSATNTAWKKTGTKPRTLAHAAKQQLPDNRLFVCLPPNDMAASMDAFAIYSSLRSRLGGNSKILKGVQPIKTGFALILDP
jgi:hypothetical protein